MPRVTPILAVLVTATLAGCKTFEIGGKDIVPEGLTSTINVTPCTIKNGNTAVPGDDNGNTAVPGDDNGNTAVPGDDLANCLANNFIEQSAKIDTNFFALTYDLLGEQSDFEEDVFRWIDLGLDSWQIKVTRDLDKLNNQTAVVGSTEEEAEAAVNALRNKR